MSNHNKCIKSSEFAQWEYCPRQWYLAKTLGRRFNSGPSRKGMEMHEDQSHAVKNVQSAQTTFVKTTFAIGGVLCILFYLLSR